MASPRTTHFSTPATVGRYAITTGNTVVITTKPTTSPNPGVTVTLTHTFAFAAPAASPSLGVVATVVGTWPPTLAQLTQFRAYITAAMSLIATVARTGTQYHCQIIPDPRRTGGYKILVQDNADVQAGDTVTIPGIGSYAAVGVNRFGGYTTSLEILTVPS